MFTDIQTLPAVIILPSLSFFKKQTIKETEGVELILIFIAALSLPIELYTIYVYIGMTYKYLLITI